MVRIVDMFRGPSIALFSILLIAISPPGVKATSVYSMVLAGERVESGDVRAIALGGSAQLVPDSLGVLYSNPALLSRTRVVALGISQLFAVDEARSDDYTERDNSFLFPALRFAFPVMDRIVFSVGYTSRYDPEGSFVVPGVTDSGDEYVTRFTESGGLFSVPFVAAMDITKYLSVGLQFAFEEGNIEERWDIEFEDPGFAPGAGFQKSDLSGTSYGGGVVLWPFENLMIGGSYESAVDYDADVSRKYTRASLDTSFTATARMPAYATVGVTWGFGPWLVLGSYAWSDFTEFRGLYFPTDRLRTQKSLAFGVEYDGVPVGAKSLPIRVSVNYEELPFDHPRGKPIEKILVGLGTGLSARGGKAKFDFAIQVGKVGAIGENGLEDRLVRLHFGLVGGEVWTRRGGQR
jgi:long-subunit fatty acid transport protein